MTDHSFTRLLAVVVVAASCCSVLSCTGKREENEQKLDRTWQEHAPSESDLIVVADMAELRASEWYSEDSVGPRSKELSDKAGFSYDDIRSFVLACDLDSMPSLESLRDAVKLDESGQPDTSALTAANLTGVNATILLYLSKPINWRQTESAVHVFFSSITNATITHMQDEQAIVVRQDSSPMPLRITLSDDGRVVIMMAGGIRGESEDRRQLNQLLAREMSIAGHGPLRIVMQASEQLRAKLQEAASSPSDQPDKDSTAMLVGTALKPFASFEGLALAMTPAENTTSLRGEIEFGTEEHALEAEVAINNILIPLITLTMTQRSDGPISEPILQRTSTYVRGNKLELKATLSPPSASAEGTSAD